MMVSKRRVLLTKHHVRILVDATELRVKCYLLLSQCEAVTLEEVKHKSKTLFTTAKNELGWVVTSVKKKKCW